MIKKKQLTNNQRYIKYNLFLGSPFFVEKKKMKGMMKKVDFFCFLCEIEKK